MPKTANRAAERTRRQGKGSATHPQVASAGHSHPHSGLSRWALIAALLVAVLIVYAPALTLGFVNFDDPQYVLDNPHVRSGLTWNGIAWALTATHAGNWHPVTWLSHMTDVAAVWRESARTSRDERPDSSAQYALAVRAPQPHDGGDAEERRGGRTLRRASSARGVRRVGGRAQGRPQHAFRDADALGVRPIRRNQVTRLVWLCCRCSSCWDLRASRCS